MFRRRLSSLFLLIFLWVFLFFPVTGTCWAQARVAVLYPQVQEPFLSVFQSILRGVESDPGLSVRSFSLPENLDTKALDAWLEAEQVDSVIVLGRQGARAAQVLKGPSKIIVGALPAAVQGLSGISLSPAPEVLFRHLRELAPKVRDIHVVYSEVNAWLIPWAESAAAAQGLDFTAYRVQDLREAVHEYRNLLQTLRGPSQAIWLPLDNITADDELVLPLVLQGSLERGLVVFSSKPAHAQRGVLFTVFPEHFAMGQSLARMATSGQQSTGIVPLADVQLAVNLRTAFHLGLRFTPRQQERFDLVFPTR
ncbi:putative ABC transport system substrate-binding protein [Geoalkalibacter ferrihydriticus]|uniref:Putative ABC transport system substrate-binding protein n=1 Tax=Geoalkalibacter ferrihydriticus TaxID=392333 RepID=A0A1G9RAW8_9BACT|nr:putative ABC transport system substrate-binding protein [Geoalkalibacter ferrihydriticus]